MNKLKNKGFTLVELIIVVTILAILSTIAYVSFQGYTKDSRDTVRLETLKNIEKGLQLNNIKTQTNPMPDNYITIMASGEVIGYQGDIGDGVGRIIGMQKGGRDPLDNSYYTYYVNSNKNSYELLGLGESNNNVLSLGGVVKNTYALDNSNRYPIVLGSELGILLDKNKVPVQQIGGTGSIDVMTATGEYVGVKSSTKMITGTGIVLKDLNPSYFSKSIGGGATGMRFDQVSKVLVDKSGNLYGIGYYYNNSSNQYLGVDFEGNTLLGKSKGYDSRDIFISKFDNSGKPTWTKTMGGSGADSPSSSFLDNDGNIVLLGYYYNDNQNSKEVTDFNGNTLKGMTDLPSHHYFISKLDNSLNNLWLKSLYGSGSSANISYLSLDNLGNIYITGYYVNDNLNANGIFDFSGNPLLGRTSSIGYNLFISKLNSKGEQQWIKTMGGSHNQIYPSFLKLNTSNGDVYLGGKYYDNSGSSQLKDFNNNDLLGKGGDDIYVVKMDSNGNQQWIKTLGGTANEMFLSPVTLDIDGNIYVSGTYYNNSADIYNVKDFNGNQLPGLGVSIGNYRLLVKLDSISGNQLWLKSIDVNSNISNIEYYNGTLCLLGNYSNNNSDSNSVKDFAGNQLLGKSSNTAANGFFAKLDLSGNQQLIKTMGGSGTTNISNMTHDNDGNIYILGSYSNDNIDTNKIVDFNGNLLKGNNNFLVSNYFISKLDNSGNNLFIKSSTINSIYDMSFDSSGNIYIGGRYANNLSNANLITDFLGYPILGKSTTASSTYDGFIQKLLKKDLQ